MSDLSDLYDVIHRRRDVRGEFTGAAIPDDVLDRVLAAAHAAPSVGLSQPWDFILISDPTLRAGFHRHVQHERDTFAASLTGEQAERFARIKIDGVLESTMSIVVTYDPDRGSPAVLGRHAIADAGLYSVCLAIQNLWLAATAEQLGVGWVSFYREPFLRELLGIPAGIRPVAWLCLGPVSRLHDTPDLERHGWRQRRPWQAAVHHDRWQPAQGFPGHGRGNEALMQPQTPTDPFPITTATIGMAVVDSIGTEAGIVSAVQLPGTDVRPDVAAGVAEELMGSGYLRIDGTGYLSNDTYAGGEQIHDIATGDPGIVTLRITRDELFRAS